MRRLNDSVPANPFRQANRYRIQGVGQSLEQGHIAKIAVVIIFGAPIFDGYRAIIDNTCRGEPLFHRCKVDERFECRTRLTAGFDGTVKRALGVIPSANQRFHFTVAVENNGRGLTR